MTFPANQVPPPDPWVAAYGNWRESQHRADYWKALTGAQNRLLAAAQDVERFGFKITIGVEHDEQIDNEPFIELYQLTKDKTVSELTALGWTMILSPPNI